jgi:hypothetical protein
LGVVTRRIKGNLYDYYRDRYRHETYLGRSGSKEASERLKEIEAEKIKKQIENLKTKLAKLGGSGEGIDDPPSELRSGEHVASLDFQRQLEVQVKAHSGDFFKALGASSDRNGFENICAWYKDLDAVETKNFVLLSAMFPFLPAIEYDRIYETLCESPPQRKFEDILSELSLYLGPIKYDGTRIVTFWTRDYLCGILKMVENKGEFLRASDRLLDLMDYPLVRLDATNWLKRLANTSPLVVLGPIQKRLGKILGDSTQYKKHMIAAIIAESLVSEEKDGEKSERGYDLFHSYLESESASEAAFIFKTMILREAQRGREICLKIVNKLLEIDHEECLKNLISCLGFYIGDANDAITSLRMIRESLGEFEQQEDRRINPTDLIRESYQATNGLKTEMSMVDSKSLPKATRNLVRNPNFRSGLHFWHPSGGDDVKYELDSTHQCVYAREKNEDNLGRFFQDLSYLFSYDLIKVGKRYALKAAIKTKQVSTKDRLSGGATVGVSYVDQSGWTPSNAAYQCEVGHVAGTTRWKEYEKEFLLGEKPSECASLYLYFDFNSAKGEAFFSNVSLSEVK